MARLPQPGSDSGTWGGILNDFLTQAHNSDGTLKSNSVTSSQLAPSAVTTAAVSTGAITEPLLDTAVQTKLNTGAPDATTSSKGAVQLAGDLSGAADAPTVRAPLTGLINPLPDTPYTFEAVTVSFSLTASLPAGTATHKWDSVVPRMSLLGNIPAVGSGYLASRAASVNQVWAIEFVTDSSDFAVLVSRFQDTIDFQLHVDGQRVGIPPTRVTGMGATSGQSVRIQFPTSRTRTIRIGIGYGGFAYSDLWGIRLIAGGTRLFPAPPRKKMLFIGDSYGRGGHGSLAGLEGTAILPQQLSVKSGMQVFTVAIGGTGYVHSATPYGHADRMAAISSLTGLDLIMVFGSANDYVGAYTAPVITAAATSLYDALAAAHPGVPIVVAGCEPWPAASLASLQLVDNAYKAAAEAHPNVVGFISMLYPAPWITGLGRETAPADDGNADLYYVSDALHPNISGHEYFASRIMTELVKFRGL